MKLLAKAAVAASTLTMVAVAAPATAATTTYGHYSQTTNALSCTGHVQDDGDGGTLSVAVKGMETRPSDKHFRAWKLKTNISAQEKNYAGAWVTVATGGYVYGKLGPAYSNDAGTVNYSPFTWGGSTNPTLGIRVSGFDDLFRAKVVTRIFDDEGARIAVLTTYQGQCRL
jgi:hypothetical protein